MEPLRNFSRKVEVHNSIGSFGEALQDDNSKTGVDASVFVKVNGAEVPKSKSSGIRANSVWYGSDRQCILNGQNMRLGQANKSQTESMFRSQPPRTPERRNLPMLRISLEIEENIETDGGILSKYSETERSQRKSQNGVMTPSMKAFQIRKSLQTIGKFIYCNERSARISNQAESPSPVYSNGRRLSGSGHNQYMLRRQSLIGLNSSGGDHSRRASIGGKFSMESKLISWQDAPNSKTPSPKQYSKMSIALHDRHSKSSPRQYSKTSK